MLVYSLLPEIGHSKLLILSCGSWGCAVRSLRTDKPSEGASWSFLTFALGSSSRLCAPAYWCSLKTSQPVASQQENDQKPHQRQMLVGNGYGNLQLMHEP